MMAWMRKLTDARHALMSIHIGHIDHGVMCIGGEEKPGLSSPVVAPGLP